MPKKIIKLCDHCIESYNRLKLAGEHKKMLMEEIFGKNIKIIKVKNKEECHNYPKQ